MKTLSLLTLCAALFSFGGAAYAQIDQSEPQLLIRTATQQILDEVRTRTIAPDDIPRIIDIVNRDILPYTDFHRTTSLAMGRYWRTATPTQQQLVEQFKMIDPHLFGCYRSAPSRPADRLPADTHRSNRYGRSGAHGRNQERRTSRDRLPAVQHAAGLAVV
jgi:hypothetical protein